MDNRCISPVDSVIPAYQIACTTILSDSPYGRTIPTILPKRREPTRKKAIFLSRGHFGLARLYKDFWGVRMVPGLLTTDVNRNILLSWNVERSSEQK